MFQVGEATLPYPMLKYGQKRQVVKSVHEFKQKGAVRAVVLNKIFNIVLGQKKKFRSLESKQENRSY